MKVKGKSLDSVWESYIRRECDYLRRQGLADVRKNWEAPKRKGHVRAETSAPDFGGCALVRGVTTPILFEAKSTHKGLRLPLSYISASQMEDLMMRAKLGGIAFVYVVTAAQSMHIVRVWSNGFREHLTSRGGSLALGTENEKHAQMTWLDYIEGKGWTP